MANVLFPWHERIKGHSSVAALRALERSQALSRSEIKALQDERLQRLLERAATKVPYYQTLFAIRGVDWRTIRSTEDLSRLPLLTKAEIRRAGDALLAADHGPLKQASTSGSTGESLRFQLGRERISHDVAGRWRATRWWHVDFGDPEVVFWSSPIEAGRQDRLREIRDAALRSHFIDAQDLSESRVPTILREIERIDPHMIYAHTSAIARLAAYALKQKLTPSLPRLKVVFVTAAKLMEDRREAIRGVFGAPVADCYGGRDAGIVANECPQGSMHISEEDVIVEIVNDRGEVLPPGELGEIVVTHLASGDFPFIRYRTGDRGMLGSTDCACGMHLRHLRAVEGRMNDLLTGPEGRVMHHAAISNVLRDIDGLLNYRVVQEREDLIRIQIVSEEAVARTDGERVEAVLRRHLGDRMRIEIERVADIQPEPSGKHRYVLNLVRQVA